MNPLRVLRSCTEDNELVAVLTDNRGFDGIDRMVAWESTQVLSQIKVASVFENKMICGENFEGCKRNRALLNSFYGKEPLWIDGCVSQMVVLTYIL